MKSPLNILVILLITSLFACNQNERSKSENQGLSDQLYNEFSNTFKKDEIDFDTLLVIVTDIDEGKKVNIWWQPKMNESLQFRKIYVRLLLSEIRTQTLKEFDSLVFEIEFPLADEPVTRYSANKAELLSLQLEQQNLPKKYREFIHFVARNRLIYAVDYFDLYMSKMNSFPDKIEWLEDGFLKYTKSMYQRVKVDSLRQNEVRILRKFMGDGTIWHNQRGPYDVVNYLLLDNGEDSLRFTLSDTLEYGVYPEWFSEVGIY